MLAKLKALAKYADRVLVAMQGGILIFASLMLAGLMVTEVISRYFLGYPIWGWEELAMLSAMWIYMIGAAMAAYDRSHLKTEIMPLLIKDPRKLRLTRALALLIALVMAGFMVYWSSDLFFWGLEQRPLTPVFHIPWVVAQSSLFLAAILISIYFLHELVDNIRSIFNPQDFSGEEVK